MQMLVKRARRGDAEAFVELMESCKSSMYLKTWLIRILINSCNRLKREQKKYDLVGEERETGYIENSWMEGLRMTALISDYFEWI